ncbi:hypothetical protein BC830DRAFT_1091520 [Chytriomyces sp. MP71]|nr:hypothetical protein BC830DRAFT_1091520 [Chytriomyces sp. MP71]
MEEGGFTLVSRNRGKAAMPRSPPPRNELSQGFTYKSTNKNAGSNGKPKIEQDARSVSATLDAAINSMRISALYTTLLLDLAACSSPIPTRSVACISYGIGSPASSSIALHQLALLVLMHRQFEVTLLPVLDAQTLTPHHAQFTSLEAFDPVFTRLDCEVLKLYGITPIETNERAHRIITGPTLFYMPHCGHTMYSTLLSANWSSRKLSQIRVIGNTFAAYELIPRQAAMQRQSPQLMKVLPYTRAVSMDTVPYGAGDVFNNTSYHWFDGVDEVPDEDSFWTVIEAEVVDDGEVV